MFKRWIVDFLAKRFNEKRQFIQALNGPRQSGKTTIARQIMEMINMPSHYVSADEPVLKNQIWIEQQWEVVRLMAKSRSSKVLLILDEIQKIPQWSETVKRLWDEDTHGKRNIYVIILGSSPLLMHRGLSESLAGRFEVIHVPHWSFIEMKEAFNVDLDTFIYYGGYPGGISLISDHQRWSNYIMESLIETTISRDILLMTRIDKPALLRRLFELGSRYSCQILSYQKMLGQLQDAGNTITLAHYLRVLEGAGLLGGLFKYAGQQVRQRSSSPKFLILNTGLLSAQTGVHLEEIKKDKEMWGRLVESAVGAHLYNSTKNTGIELFYWAGYNREVDFVLKKWKTLVAIEVKSSKKKSNLPGMEMFSKEFKVHKRLLVGDNGIPIKQFLSCKPNEWFE